MCINDFPFLKNIKISNTEISLLRSKEDRTIWPLPTSLTSSTTHSSLATEHTRSISMLEPWHLLFPLSGKFCSLVFTKLALLYHFGLSANVSEGNVPDYESKGTARLKPVSLRPVVTFYFLNASRSMKLSCSLICLLLYYKTPPPRKHSFIKSGICLATAFFQVLGIKPAAELTINICLKMNKSQT